MTGYPLGSETVSHSPPPILAAAHFPDHSRDQLADLIQHPILFVSIEEACRSRASVLLVGPEADRALIEAAIRAWFREGDNRPLLVCPGQADLAAWLETPEMDNLVWATFSLPPGRTDRRIIQRAVESSRTEVSRLRESLVSLEARNQGLQDLARKLKWDASTCPLTGAFNRRAIDALLEAELARNSGACALAVGLVDIDHFRETNKRHLHTGGDLVLRGAAGVMAASIRESDALGRIGGDEFLVLARNTGIEGASVLGERIRRNIESADFHCHSGVAKASVSIGFAVAPPGVPAMSIDMKELAARALRAAKEGGRNRVVISLHGS